MVAYPFYPTNRIQGFAMTTHNNTTHNTTPHTTTIFGGSGFLGRHIVKRLAARGDIVKVAVRHPERANFLKPMGDVGQIVLLKANLQDPAAVIDVVAGSDTVINCVGLLAESGRQRFASLHVDGVRRIAQAAEVMEVDRFIHLSAIGADPHADALYSRTKGLGEQAAREAFPNVTILRPSLVFGAEDKFFNLFAGFARWLPALPVFGGGHNKFQPVYVGDVADAVMAALNNPDTAGKTFELGGPATYSFRQLLQLMLQITGYNRLLIPVPMPLAYLQALILERLPTPLLTRDQLRLLKKDNVVADKGLTLKDLGITPTALETILPTYLTAFKNPKDHRGAQLD